MTPNELELQVMQLQRQLSDVCETIDKLVSGSANIPFDNGPIKRYTDRMMVNRQTLQLLRVQGFDGSNLLKKQGVKA